MEIATINMSRVSNGFDNKKTNGQKGRWTRFEDDKLKQLVEQMGPLNWKTIGLHFPGRTGKSCRQRWYCQLAPNINKEPFTKEEEERLFEAHRTHGNHWAVIAKLFPGRTDSAVRNRIMGRRKREGSSPTDTSPFNQIRSPNFTLPRPSYYLYPFQRYQMDNRRGYNPWPYTSASAPRSGQLGTSWISNVHHEIDLERGKSNHQAATPDHGKNSSGEDGTSMIDHGEKRDVPFYDFLGVVGLDLSLGL